MKNKKNTKIYFANVISGILLLFFLVQCFEIFQNIYTTQMVRKLTAQLTEIRTVSQDDWSHGMKEINDDYVGWLTVYGTNISLPVVQGENNEEYLRRSIYGDWCEAGTLFLDETVDLTQDGNMMIYGHLMNDGTMFAELAKFKDKDFINDGNNRIIEWECESGTFYYKVFAAMIVPGSASSGNFVNFQEWMNTPELDVSKNMLSVIEERSFFFQDELFRKPDNQYLFLTTCDYSKSNMRLVVVAERL